MSKPPATWRSAWTRFLLCEMRRCKHAIVFRLCRASLTALRAPMFESRRDSSVQPEVGCVAAYLGSTFKSSTTPTRVASIFGARPCAKHQPQQLWRIECIHPLSTLRLVLQTQPRSDERLGHNSFRVVILVWRSPRVARSSQPWAERRNPFEIFNSSSTRVISIFKC